LWTVGRNSEGKRERKRSESKREFGLWTTWGGKEGVLPDISTGFFLRMWGAETIITLQIEYWVASQGELERT